MAGAGKGKWPSIREVFLPKGAMLGALNRGAGTFRRWGPERGGQTQGPPHVAFPSAAGPLLAGLPHCKTTPKAPSEIKLMGQSSLGREARVTVSFKYAYFPCACPSSIVRAMEGRLPQQTMLLM